MCRVSFELPTDVTAIQNLKIDLQFVWRQGASPRASSRYEAHGSSMCRIDSNNSADDGVIEDAFEKIAKLSGCGFEAIVAFFEYHPLYILSCHVSPWTTLGTVCPVLG
jgi:hypothetical protein